MPWLRRSAIINLDNLGEIRKSRASVMPAKAGIQE
jgi:hypothetical protein